MGIGNAAAAFLLSARSAGVDFSRTATLGKQDFFPTELYWKLLFEAFHLPDDARDMPLRGGVSGDRFFELLGASEVTSFDASDYEGATVVHDMNEPVGAEYQEAFSAVIDGGTLEHVFNVPQAMKNAMSMVRVGGHFLSITCGNNLLGHGFYQFSPEFFFETLTSSNGFGETRVLLALSEAEPPVFYAVASPARLGRRVELVNDQPVYILALARRVAATPIFAHHPQQSDYVAQWRETPTAGGAKPDTIRKRRRRWYKRLLQPVRRLVPGPLSRRRRRLGFGQSCFARLSLETMARGELQHRFLETGDRGSV
jgi:hypothetical protein